MKSKKMIIIFILVITAVLATGGYYCYFRKTNTWIRKIEAGEKPVTNPLKGFAAWGENYREDPWVSFAYVPVYWSLLEPEEGVYDFAELEERCSFEKWKDDNVRLIFRVITDTPSGKKHMDIPRWLYEKTGGAGTWYDCSYGKGFSPDYENKIFQEAHARLIQALYERYGENPQLAFIQLGSLGHWGEWHVNTNAGIARFLLQAVTDGYVQDYLDYFPAAMLLLRRPYHIGAKEGLGLYNDSFGQNESHELWLPWISDGYVSDQNGETLSGMPDFWKKAPSGGEFAAAQEDSWYFSETQFAKTMELMQKSYTTFLGPNVPKCGEYDENTEENVEKLLQEMGYCLGVRKCKITRGLFQRELCVDLQWENTGIAPLYGDWKICLEIRDSAGAEVWSEELDSNISSWGPGTHDFSACLAGTEKLPKGEYTLWAGITDPLTEKTGVSLQMETEQEEGLYQIAEFTIQQ